VSKRRPLSIVVLAIMIVAIPGCFTVNAVAPPGPDVTILPPDVPVEVTRRYQKWYAIFGLFQLSPTSDVRDIIARERLVQVRVYTEDSVEDSLAGFFYTLIFPMGILLPQMVVVEGNRAPGDPGPDGRAAPERAR
jgi:hypothetical protein